MSGPTQASPDRSLLLGNSEPLYVGDEYGSLTAMALTHRTKVELSQPFPAEVGAGTAITLKVRVSCSEDCDFSGASLQVLAEDGMLVADALLGHENQVEDIQLRAPPQIGKSVWSILFPRYDVGGVIHEQSSLAVKSDTTPHTTSVAVWDVPSPVVMRRPFTVKVGVKCSALCQLTGRLVQVHDEAGAEVGQGKLGGTPWRGTDALYEVDVALTAPDREGMYSWSVRFKASEPGLPHRESSATLTFRTAEPAEHSVAVQVVQQETNDPLKSADVRLGIYRARTDERGLASLEVPKGTYEVDAWKTGFETVPQTVEVTGDVTLQVVARPVPQPDPDFKRTWM